MSKPLQSALPPDLNLYAGCIVRFVGLDPTTGNEVSGIVLDNASMWVTNLAGGSNAALEVGPWKLVPGPQA